MIGSIRVGENDISKMQPNEIVDEATGDEVDSTGSGCAESAKSNKPLMEKRRRARINKSLNELKTMLLRALKGNSCGHSKLEKADILEMTVRYMKKLEQHRARTTRIDPSVLNKYKAGFSECRNEVMKFLSTHEGVSVEVRTRLLDHLANCQQSLQDQDQENLMEDEFVEMDATSSWRQSPTSTEERLTQVSPSTSQVENPKNGSSDSRSRPSIEKRPTTDDRVSPDQTEVPFVRGQRTIAADASPLSRHSSLCSAGDSPLKDINQPIISPTNIGICRSLDDENEPHCSHGCTASRIPDNENNVAMRPPEITHHMTRGIPDDNPYSRQHDPLSRHHLAYRVGYAFQPLQPATSNFRGKANSDGFSTDASLSPDMRLESRTTVDYSQLDLVQSDYRQAPTHRIQSDAKERADSQKIKGPWRPWSHEGT